MSRHVGFLVRDSAAQVASFVTPPIHLPIVTRHARPAIFARPFQLSCARPQSFHATLAPFALTRQLRSTSFASTLGAHNCNLLQVPVHCTRHRLTFPSPSAFLQARWTSSQPSGHEAVSSLTKPNDPHSGVSPSSPSTPTSTSPSSTNNVLRDRLPHRHRPTKEELLAAATGFWQRLAIRFKWFSIRSARPFNTDEISAILSWIFLGHLVWVIVGTTTFFSLAILALNTVFAQETLAGWVGNYLTKSSGIKVVFESAIVPKWGDGVITFRNVFVSRRPGQGKANVRKGSSATAAAAAAAARVKDSDGQAFASNQQEDNNYTQFDLSISTINVTLSFAKWLNGKGLLRDVEIKGVRGVVDRTSVHPADPNVDPTSYRHKHATGDFEIDTFKMEDLLVTILQSGKFRPFSASIFSCELPRLRKQWLFYDLMCASNISGSFDDSLFTIHPRQEYSHTSLADDRGVGSPGAWKNSRIRVDGLNVDHLNRGVQGPFSWISEGKVDVVADVMFPNDDEASIAKFVGDFYDRVEATVTNHQDPQRPMPDSQEALSQGLSQDDKFNSDQDRFFVMDLRIHLCDVRATVPIFNKHLSYVNNALIRPIVAYINANRAFIPINCRVVKRVDEFDGSWTLFDSGLMHDLSRETYDAFARDIGDHNARRRRLKKVGLWTIQLAVQAFFIGLAGQLA